MKIFFILLILILPFNAFAFSEGISKVSILKKELIEVQGLRENQNLGTFGSILNEMFFWFIDEINVEKYIGYSDKNKNKKAGVSISGISVMLFKNKRGLLERVVYTNRYLYPIEIRGINIDFSDQDYTSVKIWIETISRYIKKEVILNFHKGETEPFNKMPNCFYWGQMRVNDLKSEFNIIRRKIVEQDFISSETKNIGFLGQFLDSMFAFRQKLKNQDIFVIKNQKIKGFPLQNLRADCFFIGSNASCIVIYNGKNEIVSVYKIIKYNVLKVQALRFSVDGLRIISSRYDPKNKKLVERKIYKIPYTKTEPEAIQ